MKKPGLAVKGFGSCEKTTPLGIPMSIALSEAKRYIANNFVTRLFYRATHSEYQSQRIMWLTPEET